MHVRHNKIPTMLIYQIAKAWLKIPPPPAQHNLQKATKSPKANLPNPIPPHKINLPQIKSSTNLNSNIIVSTL